MVAFLVPLFGKVELVPLDHGQILFEEFEPLFHIVVFVELHLFIGQVPWVQLDQGQVLLEEFDPLFH